VSDSPFLRRGRNWLFAVPVEVKYKISVFVPKAKKKPAKYFYGYASRIVGLKKSFISTITLKILFKTLRILIVLTIKATFRKKLYENASLYFRRSTEL